MSILEQQRPATGARRVDASMSLLNDIFANSLEPGYAAAAARRAAQADTEPRRTTKLPIVLLAAGAVIALVFTAAASELRHSADVISAERAELLERIDDYSREGDRLERAVASLEQENLRLQSSQLKGANASKEAQESLARTQAAAGTAAVVGPGVRITVENPPTDGVDSIDAGDESRVLDVDLQRVVNGLWAAGAEAISINDQRLTALSAIRSANEVVLVNYRPLNPPYEILAIGDPDTLPARFLEGSGGQWLRDIASLYGITFDVQVEERLNLPGHTAGTLRHVELGEGQ